VTVAGWMPRAHYVARAGRCGIFLRSLWWNLGPHSQLPRRAPSDVHVGLSILLRDCYPTGSRRMHGTHDYLAGLAQIHTRESVEDRRVLWRQGLASLAVAASDQQPTPLEGLATEPLLNSVRVAVSSGLIDDLSFLSRPVAMAALFELAGALPPGPEKRELGRRVLTALHEGDAATFVTLATSLALASPRALGGALVRARVALSLRLPIAAGTGADTLALALISRPELEREWLTAHSLGALPSRRMAGRLLERAAREAARRAKEGDDSGVCVFERPAVRAAWSRLISDRESLVWRHVAAARGLLAAAVPMLAEEIERDLAPRLGPSEWRRAATSLAATLSHDPDKALARCLKILAGEITVKDPGVPSVMIFGLSRAVEEEPEASEELLTKLVLVGGTEAIEALVDLHEEHAGNPIGAQAAFSAVQTLRATAPTDDDGAVALVQALMDDLDMGAAGPKPTVRSALAAALRAFAEGRDLGPATDAALEAANDAIAILESTGDATSADRQALFRALRELDAGLLQTSTLSDLLTVRSREDPGPDGPLADMLWLVGSWLLGREQQLLTAKTIPHVTLHFRQLRTLLHLVDAEFGAGEDPSIPVRSRCTHTFRMLCERVRGDKVTPLRRLTCAIFARAADAVVREQVYELSDAFIAACWCVQSTFDLRCLAEACMAPEFRELFAAMSEVALLVGERSGRHVDEQVLVESLRGVAEALPPGSSARVEGLRRGLLGITRALEAFTEAQCVSELRRGDDGTALDRLAGAITYAARLIAGATRRTGLREGFFPSSSTRGLRKLDAWVERALLEKDEGMGAAAAVAAEAVRQDLPPLFAEVVGRVLLRIGRLPRDVSASAEMVRVVKTGHQIPLPPWLPPSRTMGGFYIVRPIGTGAGGSVFVARRTEERHEESAEAFALKVPAYTGAAARTLSEEEFLRLFREEAGALLTLPTDKNLAGFVTFDAGAKPKPILVMELVQGPTLERLLDKRAMSMPLALDVLDGLAAGLEAMHRAGIGHLDVKPSNVILRYADEVAPQTHSRQAPNVAPVLVDFGLAGRKVRPGCGSPYYGAPEVWDTASFGDRVDPRATDVYSFSCLAYELLTGATLFSGDALPAIIAAHLIHEDGPETLRWLRKHGQAAALADLLSLGLRRNPRKRLALSDMRAALSDLGHNRLRALSWPLRA